METSANDRYDVATYRPRLESVPTARRRVTRLAGEWGHSVAAEDATLITSELVTNAGAP
jgi:hypothetical protein